MESNKTQQFTYQDRLHLKQNILNLSKSDWKSICTCILIPNEEKITINTAGVYFCLMSLSDDTIIKINQYIKHTQQMKNEHTNSGKTATSK